MKPILCHLILSSLTLAASLEFVGITTHSGESFRGQEIHTYEARWFWEKVGEGWVAMLPANRDLSQLIFLPQKDIAKRSVLSTPKTNFLNLMKENNLFFQRLPFSGRTFVSTGNDGHHLRENMYGDFAWDFVKQTNGKSYSGDPTKLASYFTYGEKVFSPIEGIVADVFRKTPDNPADPTLSSSLASAGDGNFVLIKVGGNLYASLLHFKEGTIPTDIHVGSKIEVGQYLGEVGNSGRSYVPHLHMTTYFYSARWGRMFSIPNRFEEISEIQNGVRILRRAYSPKTGKTYINRP